MTEKLMTGTLSLNPKNILSIRFCLIVSMVTSLKLNRGQFFALKVVIKESVAPKSGIFFYGKVMHLNGEMYIHQIKACNN